MVIKVLLVCFLIVVVVFVEVGKYLKVNKFKKGKFLVLNLI